MARHTFAIVAHDQFDLLETLVRSLEHPEVRIVLHLNVADRPGVLSAHPNLAYLPSVPRVRVRWGTFSLLQAQLRLLGAAVEQDTEYVHLLSGKDLLLKPVSDLVQFFDEHAGAEFVRIRPTSDMTARLASRVARFQMDALTAGKNISGPVGVGMRALQYASEGAQRLVGVDRTRGWGRPVRSGSPWFSVTSGLARYFVDHAGWAYQHLRRTFVPEEFFYPTIAASSPMRGQLHAGAPGQAENLRHIRWDPGQRGHPHVWTAEDVTELNGSANMFARKFDMVSHPEAVAAVAEMSARTWP